MLEAVLAAAQFRNAVLVDTPVGPAVRQVPQSLPEFHYLWVSTGIRRTVLKIDSVSGQVLGEYLTSPDGIGANNAARFAVDLNGNVWVGTTNTTDTTQGIVTRVSAQPPSSNTSTGRFAAASGLPESFDARPWTTDASGQPVPTDSAVGPLVRTDANNVVGVAIAPDGRVWVGGLRNRVHEAIDPDAGTPVAGTAANLGGGGYGVAVDGRGVLWSAQSGSAEVFPGIVRHDPATGETRVKTRVIDLGHRIQRAEDGSAQEVRNNSYNVAVDPRGEIWATTRGAPIVHRLAPDGTVIATYDLAPAGLTGTLRGVAFTPDGDVWVAASSTDEVVRLDRAGVVKEKIPVGPSPIGLGVDAAGKVWSVNNGRVDRPGSLTRIDPAGGPAGTAVADLWVEMPAGIRLGSYNADITGGQLAGVVSQGRWTYVFDAGTQARWHDLLVAAEQAAETRLEIVLRVSNDLQQWSDPMTLSAGTGFDLLGRYLEVTAQFARAWGADPSLSAHLFGVSAVYQVPEPSARAVFALAVAVLLAGTVTKRSMAVRSPLC